MNAEPTRGASVPATRVEAARKIQARGCAFGIAQRADVRIDRDLKESETAPDQKQRKQEQRIGDDDRGRQEEQKPCTDRRKRSHDAVLVADAPYDTSGRNGQQKVRTEEGELHQEGTNIRKLEQVLEVRNQYVIHRGDESNSEVKRQD